MATMKYKKGRSRWRFSKAAGLMDVTPKFRDYKIFSSSNTGRVPKDFMLKMKSGQVIPYTDTCNYLGNTICSQDENVIIDNSITDMNMRLNNLLS